MLTRKALLELIRYDAETGKLFWREREMPRRRGSSSWNKRYANKEALTARGSKGHLTGTLLGKSVQAHRVIWFLVKGRWPKGQIDHINGDPTDNRIENLRDVDNSTNCRNKRQRRALPFGVYERRDGGVGYVASISWRENGGSKKNRHLGSFITIEEAVAARKAAEALLGFHENHGRKGKSQ